MDGISVFATILPATVLPWNATVSVSKKASQSNQLCYYCKAVQWFRSLVAGLSSRKPTFASGSIYVGFVVDEATLGQVFLSLSISWEDGQWLWCQTSTSTETSLTTPQQIIIPVILITNVKKILNEVAEGRIQKRSSKLSMFSLGFLSS
jgi:hypothetical protein